MAKSGKRQFADDQRIDAADQNSDGEESADVSSSSIESTAAANPSISRRLTDIFMEDGDEDLLLQSSDIGDGFLQWLQALDMQVMGACRADERLKPLLKLNISSGEAEDRLLAQLCEHFEPSEVGLLARCLCAPLVSIRVGKINKQGTLLSPTSIRGTLYLILLPTSDLRIAFNGDDGSMERLAILSSEAECTSIEIEEISADKSGRSFCLRIADDVVFYFWCSEKSQLLGAELLRKMKDLLIRKPSLAELTGISDGRLNSFATQLRANIGGSTVINAQSSAVLPSSCHSNDDSVDSSELHYPQSSFACEKRPRGHDSMANLNHLGIVHLKSNSFEAGLPKSLSSEKITAKGKIMQAGDDSIVPNSWSLASTSGADPSNSIGFTKGKLPEANLVHPFTVLNVVDAFGKPLELPLSGPKVQVPSSSSPHYCWCPPVASALHYTLRNSQMPALSPESFRLPPLSSLLSAAGPSSLLTSKSSLNLSKVPTVDFPSFQPEPFISLPTSQQIPTFTPLICDPIVHIPMIGVCSSGPGYLVSAGLAIATTIPPLNLNLVDPLVLNSESVVEKSAKETLRMLINSPNSQPNSQLLEILPPVLSSSDDMPNAVGNGGSRGLYCGTRDVHAGSGGLTNMGFMFLSEKSGVGNVCPSRDDSADKERAHDTDSSGFDTGMM
ncbi:hypothetical protein C2S51_033761 [Perilla frutescens var. frutescens]|nr:hypothetical protein C2S51_033761 [Perilla frutescens var. frutescens]